MTAPGTVTVTVTAEHIANGVRGDCGRCPVALALADAFPGAAFISVSGSDWFSLQAAGTEAITEAHLPFKAQSFIWDFDGGHRVEPFSFTVDCPAVTP